MKICTLCNREQEDNEFRFRNKAKGSRSPWCKSCFSQYEKKLWRESETRRKSNINSNRIRRLRNQQYLWEYLANHGCETCGESDPVVLQFDHINKNEKVIGISHAVSSSYSLDAIKKEMAKCRVLCANCHMRRTAEQMGWHKYIVRQKTGE